MPLFFYALKTETTRKDKKTNKTQRRNRPAIAENRPQEQRNERGRTINRAGKNTHGKTRHPKTRNIFNIFNIFNMLLYPLDLCEHIHEGATSQTGKRATPPTETEQLNKGQGVAVR